LSVHLLRLFAALRLFVPTWGAKFKLARAVRRWWGHRQRYRPLTLRPRSMQRRQQRAPIQLHRPLGKSLLLDLGRIQTELVGGGRRASAWFAGSSLRSAWAEFTGFTEGEKRALDSTRSANASNANYSHLVRWWPETID